LSDLSTQAFPNNVYALDLNNDQKILWSYFPKQELSTQAVLYCDNVNRGLGFGDGKIYLQQNNGVLACVIRRMKSLALGVLRCTNTPYHKHLKFGFEKK
jgi:hypothetical protein